MNSIQLKSRAKINLSIDVLGKREDGYHLVEMIMQTIDLFDKIKIFSLKEDTIIIESNSLDIPLDSTNIVYKAADLIKKQYNIKEGVKIIIEKNIPIAAGMAGGSSNAAAVLVGLNQLWQLKLSENKLKELGLKLGADVPFCIGGQTALAENIGEKLTKIDGLSENIFILVCKPELFVSTKEIYEEIDSKIIQQIADNMYNVLEEVTRERYPVIEEIEKIMMENDALGSMMSGSGPTVFGLYINREDAENCKNKLLKKFSQVYIVKSHNKGVEIYG